MSVDIEKLDICSYQVTSGDEVYVLRWMKQGRHRWGMFREVDSEDDDLVLIEADTEKAMLGEAVIYALHR